MLDNYRIDEFGILHQIRVEPFTKDYGIERNGYGQKSMYLSYLRLGFMLAHVEYMGIPLESILDVGFGNGDFLRVAQHRFKKCYGYDLDYTYLPQGCIKAPSLYDHYDVITFFDSYEHFDELSFIKNLNCRYLVISVPNCKNPEDDEWLSKWKHLRPNEHLHHFSRKPMYHWLKANNYKVLNISYLEDIIRVNPEEDENILTAIAVKL